MATSRGATTGSDSAPSGSAPVKDTLPPSSTRVNVKPLSPEEEVAARTADTSESASDKFVKVYTVLKSVPLTDEIHDANRVNVVREMVNRGMRVPNDKSVVQYEGSEDAPDGESVYLTYSVSALPAGRLPEDAPLNRIQVQPGKDPKDPSI